MRWVLALPPGKGCANICAHAMENINLGAIFGTLCCLLGGPSKATAQPANQLTPVPIQSVTIEDSFWSPKRKVWQEVTIPDCFDKFESDRDGALNNFDRVRDGKAHVYSATIDQWSLLTAIARHLRDIYFEQSGTTLAVCALTDTVPARASLATLKQIIRDKERGAPTIRG